MKHLAIQAHERFERARDHVERALESFLAPLRFAAHAATCNTSHQVALVPAVDPSLLDRASAPACTTFSTTPSPWTRRSARKAARRVRECSRKAARLQFAVAAVTVGVKRSCCSPSPGTRSARVAAKARRSQQRCAEALNDDEDDEDEDDEEDDEEEGVAVGGDGDTIDIVFWTPDSYNAELEPVTDEDEDRQLELLKAGHVPTLFYGNAYTNDPVNVFGVRKMQKLVEECYQSLTQRSSTNASTIDLLLRLCWIPNSRHCCHLHADESSAQLERGLDLDSTDLRLKSLANSSDALAAEDDRARTRAGSAATADAGSSSSGTQQHQQQQQQRGSSSTGGDGSSVSTSMSTALPLEGLQTLLESCSRISRMLLNLSTTITRRDNGNSGAGAIPVEASDVTDPCPAEGVPGEITAQDLADADLDTEPNQSASAADEGAVDEDDGGSLDVAVSDDVASDDVPAPDSQDAETSKDGDAMEPAGYAKGGESIWWPFSAADGSSLPAPFEGADADYPQAEAGPEEEEPEEAQESAQESFTPSLLLGSGKFQDTAALLSKTLGQIARAFSPTPVPLGLAILCTQIMPERVLSFQAAPADAAALRHFLASPAGQAFESAFAANVASATGASVSAGPAPPWMSPDEILAGALGVSEQVLSGSYTSRDGGRHEPTDPSTVSPYDRATTALVENGEAGPRWRGASESMGAVPLFFVPGLKLVVPVQGHSVQFWPVFLSRVQLVSAITQLREAAAVTWLARRRAGRDLLRRRVEAQAASFFRLGRGGNTGGGALDAVMDADEDGDEGGEPPEAKELLAELGADGGAGNNLSGGLAPGTGGGGLFKSIELISVGAVSLLASVAGGLSDAIDRFVLVIPGGRQFLGLHMDPGIQGCSMSQALTAARVWNARTVEPAEAALATRRQRLEREINDILTALAEALKDVAVTGPPGSPTSSDKATPPTPPGSTQPSPAPESDPRTSKTPSPSPAPETSDTRASAAPEAERNAVGPDEDLVDAAASRSGTAPDRAEAQQSASAPSEAGATSDADTPQAPIESSTTDAKTSSEQADAAAVPPRQDDAGEARRDQGDCSTSGRSSDAAAGSEMTTSDSKGADFSTAWQTIFGGAAAGKLRSAVKLLRSGGSLSSTLVDDVRKALGADTARAGDGTAAAATMSGLDEQELERLKSDVDAVEDGQQFVDEQQSMLTALLRGHSWFGPPNTLLHIRLIDFLQKAIAERRALVQNMLVTQRAGKVNEATLEALLDEERQSRLRLMRSLLSMGAEIATQSPSPVLGTMQSTWLSTVNSLLAIDQASPLAPLLQTTPNDRRRASQLKSVSNTLDFLTAVAAACHWTIEQEPRLLGQLVDPIVKLFPVQSRSSIRVLEAEALTDGVPHPDGTNAPDCVSDSTSQATPPAAEGSTDTGVDAETDAAGSSTGEEGTDAEALSGSQPHAHQGARGRGGSWPYVPEQGMVYRVNLDLLAPPAGRLDPHNGTAIELDWDQATGLLSHEMLRPHHAATLAQVTERPEFRGLLLIGDVSSGVFMASGPGARERPVHFGYL